jgi:predicted SAM-dependent methyltransferase
MNHLELPSSYGSLSRGEKAAVRAGIEVRSLVGRVTARRTLAGATRLHLGSGDHVLPGWANIDALALPGVTPWDLRKPLPVADDSIDLIYSEHFIEHVTRDQAARLLGDCHRALRPGGVIRLSTPDLAKLIEEYQAGRLDEWADVDWRPATPAQLVNEAVREWGHLFIFDYAELSGLLREIGYRDVTRVRWRESRHAPLNGLECRPDHGEVIVEATK